MSRTTPQPVAMMSRMGGHLAISLSIALAIAGATSLPRWLDAGPAAGPGIVPIVDAVQPAGEGKFIDRMSLAAGEDHVANRPFTPAMFAMPMAASWPEPAASEPKAAPPAKLRSAAADPVPLPPRRDPRLDDRRMASAAPPLPILAVVEAPRPGEKREERSWTRIVTMPAALVVDVVSGTAGMAQAAGSWTLSQASELLPRW